LVVLGIWLNLFAGGILIETKQYRCAISPGGVEALQPRSAPPKPCGDAEPAPPFSSRWFTSWFFVLFLFLPLNLALICVTAGALGTFGSLAKLHDDQSRNSPADYSNPYVSGLLRGFFVYLFLISGLLLFDDDPFSSPSPGQYIRLAGFLSLFSFIVNYQPRTFSTLIDWAHARIHAKGRKSDEETGSPNTASVTAHVGAITDPRDGRMAVHAEIAATSEEINESNPKEKPNDIGDARQRLSE